MIKVAPRWKFKAPDEVRTALLYNLRFLSYKRSKSCWLVLLNVHSPQILDIVT